VPDDTKATTGIAVWDRQPTETSRQFAVFRVYRNANPLHRSLTKVAQQLGCSETYVQRLSTRHQWVARVEAFDAEQDRVEQRQRTRRIKD
jgi:AraC-like DNA-binding protein